MEGERTNNERGARAMRGVIYGLMCDMRAGAARHTYD